MFIVRSIANTLNQLGTLYRIAGQYDLAEENYTLAFDMQQKMEDSNQAYVIQSMEYLAELHNVRGNSEEADILFRQIIEKKKASLGDEHPDIAHTLVNWGRLFCNKKDYEKAEKLYKQSLEIRKKYYGERHSETAFSYQFFGVLCYKTFRYEESENYLKKAIEINKEIFGEDSLTVAISTDNLGKLYFLMEKYDEAEEQYFESMNIINNACGKDNLSYAYVLYRLGELYHAREEYVKAKQPLEGAYEVRRRVFPPEHPDIVKCIKLLEDIDSKLRELSIEQPV